MTAQTLLQIWICDATQCPSKDLLAPTGVSSPIHLDLVLNLETNPPQFAGRDLTTKSLGYDPLDRTSITRHTSWQTNITSTLSTNVSWDDPISEDMLPLGEKMANRTSTPRETYVSWQS